MREANFRLLPITLANELRCKNCNAFLSCGPVRAVNDGGSSCGRCVQFTGKQYHNQAYEEMAKFFRFPCINWNTHCPVSLSFNESLNHEDHCSYTGCLSFFCAHPGACCSSPRTADKVQEPNIQLVPLNEQTIQKFSCLSCSKPLSCAPVYLTSDGYDVCHRCANRREVNDSLKNVAYEILARLFIFPCAFKSKGCPARLRFGVEAFQHELVCNFGITPRLSAMPDGKVKERGVIKTHTGHYFGTITPHQPAFAPPPISGAGGFDVNREIVKSIQKKQYKQRGDLHGAWEETSETSSDGRITPDPNILNARDLDKQFQKHYSPYGDYQNQGYQPDYNPYREGPPLQYSASNASNPVNYDRRRLEPINQVPMSQSFNHGRPQPVRQLPRRISSKKEKPAYLDELVNRQNHGLSRNLSNAQRGQNPYNNLNDLREAHTRMGVPAGVYS